MSINPAAGQSNQAAMQQSVQQRQHEVEARRQAILDAGLAGLKAGLHLTPEQEKLWPPVEASIRELNKTSERMAPSQDAVASLTQMAEALDKRSKQLHAVLDALKPLVDGLSSDQQDFFGAMASSVLMGGSFFGGGFSSSASQMTMRPPAPQGPTPTPAH